MENKMKYVAILNKSNFQGFYTRVFEYPDNCNLGPAWYYLNRLDFCGCLEKVFPADIFSSVSLAEQSLICVDCKAVNHGLWWMPRSEMKNSPDYTRHTLTICPDCMMRYKAPL